MIITSAVDVSIHAVSPVSIPDVPPTMKAPRHKRGDVERLRFVPGTVATFEGPIRMRFGSDSTRIAGHGCGQVSTRPDRTVRATLEDR